MSNAMGYIKLADIKGNSQDEKHKDWIEALSISQSVSRNINPTSKPADALTTSQVHLGAIEIQKNADESSPILVAAVAQGDVFPEVTIDMVRVGDAGNEVFYQWILTDAYIASYSIQGSSAGIIDVTESLTICFSTIRWSYKKKSNKGHAKGSIDTGWDVAQNRRI